MKWEHVHCAPIANYTHHLASFAIVLRLQVSHKPAKNKQARLNDCELSGKLLNFVIAPLSEDDKQGK